MTLLIVTVLVGALLVWALCGRLAYQYTLSYFRWEYRILYEGPRARTEMPRSIVRLARLGGLLGPLGLLVVLKNGGVRHGRNWKELK